MNEITVPINRKTIKLLTEYARTLEGSQREDTLKQLEIADKKQIVAELKEKTSQLEAEIKEEEKVK